MAMLLLPLEPRREAKCDPFPSAALHNAPTPIVNSRRSLAR